MGHDRGIPGGPEHYRKNGFMIRISQLKIPCGQGEKALEGKILRSLGLKDQGRILSWQIEKHSLDARKKPDLYDIYTVSVKIKGGRKAEETLVRRLRDKNVTFFTPSPYSFPASGDRKLSERPVIIGAGPAGIFCALLLAEHGYRPLLIERGKPVEERQKDIETFWKTGRLDPSSNVQFGEGGAGAFSDGKLNTLVGDKAGRAEFVLRTFIEAGGPPEILYDAKPHIGTDRLQIILPVLRKRIQDAGGEVRFGTCCSGFAIEEGRIKGVLLEGGEYIPAQAVVFAPGHSARDTFRAIFDQGLIPVEQKNFAVGFRVSHPQALIDLGQYGISGRKEMEKLGLGPAPYKLTARAVSGRGVYSFCMCPGGYIVNASSQEGLLAVNGMSYYDRGSKRANSAIVMTVGEEDFGSSHPLAGMEFQERLEKKAFALGEGKVPVQTFQDFKARVTGSGSAYPLSGIGGGREDLCICGDWKEADLTELFPEKMNLDLLDGMYQFGKKIRGFDGPEAFFAGVETRTSSPVRIPRGEDLCSAIEGFYPCGEGAGYAGGIMSAAMDGMKTAEAIGSLFAPME